VISPLKTSYCRTQTINHFSPDEQQGFRWNQNRPCRDNFDIYRCHEENKIRKASPFAKPIGLAHYNYDIVLSLYNERIFYKLPAFFCLLPLPKLLLTLRAEK
jgi:hypothetical protein